MEPTREIYWNIVGSGLLYLLALVAVALFVWGVFRRARLWRLGTPEARWDRIWERASGLLMEVFGHRRHRRRSFPALIHVLIFYGFLAQFVATSMISLQEWSGIHFLRGSFYQGYSLLSDVFGILAIIGLCMALWRRLVLQPPHLHSFMDDWFSLGLLLVLFVQGFILEGCRIAVTELHQQPDLALWSPGGYAVALLLDGLGSDPLSAIHRSLWWIHGTTAFLFIGYLSHGKLGHVLYGPLNIFLRDLDGSGKLSHPDIEAVLDSDPDALENLGVARLDQFTWKQLLDMDACVNCGRCEEVCPAHLSGAALSPRKLVQDLKQHLHETGPAFLSASAGSEPEPGSEPDLPRLVEPSSGATPRTAVTEEEIWGCRTCGACQTECPVFVEHIPTIIDMRRNLVMTEARMGEETRQFLKNIEDRAHPWVGTPHDREGWFADLDIKVLGRGDTAEYLFWVGCTGALVDRNIKVTRAMVRVLQAAGVDFAVLGAEESCTGDPARRAGEELSFQTCAKTNIETFERYGVEKIITTCPHCFNSFKNEYTDFDGRYEVVHHTQLIADMVRSGRLRLREELPSLTYHDPCYLGRHNEVYDEPRKILRGLSQPGGFREMERSRSRALCCGSGGGYAWMDDSAPERINHQRLEDIRSSKASTTAVSCPFCMQMFDEALGAKDPEGSIRVADIAELVADALDEET
ncbi:MAG: 4Fe-4S dicluster domain-containing protein [Deltaproteobacteria bacterium]|nr:4Fe-4S dicluster domain-containing protein [Deltaproteobacteria bacterium]MBW2392700.1 4Fe-4S dicluster domain-containing protein [Deltaproteobacteria bacterium]